MNESKERPSKAIFLALPIFLASLIALLYFIVEPSKLELASELGKQPPEPEKLATAPTSDKSTDSSETIPVAIWFITLSFIVIQIGAVTLATFHARKVPLGTREVRKILFYCDTPMYLGLLGSLVGVSLTHMLTGSLTAPVAYLTTISGIILHLMAKWLVVLPLPDRAGYVN
jgi:hypothetical protein